MQHLRVMPEQLGQDRSADPFIELWFGSLSHPDIGKSVLGATGWDNLKLQLKEASTPSSSSARRGRESFKGSGFVRGGLYDRVQVRQGRTPLPSATSTI